MHNGWDILCLRYVYMLDVDNRGQKSKFFGLKRILYPGIAMDLGVRFWQHIRHINSKFLTKYFYNSRKKLVFVKQLWGNEYDAMALETKVKGFSRDRKLRLIESEDNDLVRYVPLKLIILRKYNSPSERVALKL